MKAKQKQSKIPKGYVVYQPNGSSVLIPVETADRLSGVLRKSNEPEETPGYKLRVNRLEVAITDISNFPLPNMFNLQSRIVVWRLRKTWYLVVKWGRFIIW